MENQDPKNTKKEETPAQGAASTSNDSKEVTDTTVVAEKPEWVNELLESNKATQESNQAVIDAIGEFKESAGDVVKDIFSKAKQASATTNSSVVPQVPVPVEVELNPKAKYVVAKGQSFGDRADLSIVYNAGDSVDHLEPEVLKSLLSRELIREAK